MRQHAAVLLAVFMTAASACPVRSPVCESGETQGCLCEAGESGVQECMSSGEGWMSCRCNGDRDGGVAGDSAVGVDQTATTDGASGVDGAPQGCGNVTLQGQCDGTNLSYCYQDQLVQMNCADSNLGCGLVDCSGAECFGYDCIPAVGEACFHLENNWPMCSAAAGLGCLDGVCAASSACTTGDPFSCDGSKVLFCVYGRLSNTDCAAGGEPYTCRLPPDDNTAACVGLEGGQCGTGSSGVVYACDEGLVCENDLCVVPPADAGSGVDAG